MKFELKKIHWSIGKFLASRRKGFWQFIFRRFISPDLVQDDLKQGQWLYYRRTKSGEQDIDFSNEFWEQLQEYHTKWSSFAETLDSDNVLKAIRPLENDYLIISISDELLTFSFKSGNWEVVFYDEEMIEWKCWLAYEGVIEED